MKEYIVRFEGNVIGTRKSPRVYTHAVVAEYKELPNPQAPRVFVWGFNGSEQLAHKAAASVRGRRYMARVVVVPVEVREIKRRERVRCTGLVLETKTGADGLEWARAMQCRRDAVGSLDGDNGPRCETHWATYNGAIEVEAAEIREATMAEQRRRWAARHAATYTAETCLIEAGFRKYGTGQRCSVHGAVAASQG